MHAPALQGRLLTSAEACNPTHPLPTSQLCVRQRCARVVVQGSCESSQVFCSAPAASTMSGTMTYATSSGLFSAAASTSIFPVMSLRKRMQIADEIFPAWIFHQCLF